MHNLSSQGREHSLLEVDVYTATSLLEESLEWLREDYDEFIFHVERDVVWTVQMHLVKKIKELNLPLRVYNDYPMLPGSRRARSADLVIVNQADEVEVAAEFKYEPSHQRTDIQRQKLPVVFWGTSPSEIGQGVAHDVQRIKEFVEVGKTKTAYAIFVDEGGYFRHREQLPGSRWIDWETRSAEGHKVSILWARWPAGEIRN